MNPERGSVGNLRSKPTFTPGASRSKRHLQLVEIRKQDVDAHLQQLRRQRYHEQDTSGAASNETLDYSRLAVQLSTNNEALQLNFLQEIHRQLSASVYASEQVDLLMQTTPILHSLVTLLNNCIQQPALCEAVLLILLNVASSSTEHHIQALLDLHLDDLLLAQLHFIITHVTEQAAAQTEPAPALWMVVENILNTLGNLVAGNRTLRDKLVAGRVVDITVDLLMQRAHRLTTIELGTWFLGNILRVGGLSDWQPFQPALWLFARILAMPYEHTLTNMLTQALWGVCFILQIGGFTSEPVLKICSPASIVACLSGDREHPVITAALRTVALLSAGPPEAVEQLLAVGLFTQLAYLVEHGRAATVRTTYFVLSNIVLLSPREVQMLLDHEAMRDKVISDGLRGSFDIASEAMTVLSHAVGVATVPQLDRLEFSGVLPLFVDMCYAKSADVAHRALEALIHYARSDASRILSRERESKKYEATAVETMLSAGVERALDVLEQGDHRELAAMAGHLHELLAVFAGDDNDGEVLPELEPSWPHSDGLIWNGAPAQSGPPPPSVWGNLSSWSLQPLPTNNDETMHVYEEY